jgi:hypothetical protein
MSQGVAIIRWVHSRHAVGEPHTMSDRPFPAHSDGCTAVFQVPLFDGTIKWACHQLLAIVLWAQCNGWNHSNMCLERVIWIQNVWFAHPVAQKWWFSCNAPHSCHSICETSSNYPVTFALIPGQTSALPFGVPKQICLSSHTTVWTTSSLNMGVLPHIISCNSGGKQTEYPHSAIRTSSTQGTQAPQPAVRYFHV